MQPFEVEELDLAEVGRRRLRLDRDVAAGQRRAVDLHRRIRRARAAAANLRLRVLEHRLPLDDVADELVAVDQHLDAHPLVAVVGLRRRVRAVRGAQLAVHDDVRARRAEVGGRARLAVAEPAEQLHLDRDRKVLILQHRLRRAALQHQAVVADRPGGSAGVVTCSPTKRYSAASR